MRVASPGYRAHPPHAIVACCDRCVARLTLVRRASSVTASALRRAETHPTTLPGPLGALGLIETPEDEFAGEDHDCRGDGNRHNRTHYPKKYAAEQ